VVSGIVRVCLSELLWWIYSSIANESFLKWLWWNAEKERV
jgi:hypothetical protein